MQNVREILEEPISDGKFALPSDNFTADDEVQWGKRRLDSVRVAQYADSKCGLSNTFDSTGAYLCGGRQDGGSSPCNKREGNECLIKSGDLSNPHFQSCAYWETQNAGDPEGRYCPDGKLEDERIGFGETKNPAGFGCLNCEYFKTMPRPDSEGRTGWCVLKGHTVEDKGCCWDNDPIAQFSVDAAQGGEARAEERPKDNPVPHWANRVSSLKSQRIRRTFARKKKETVGA